jgi:glycosyltransferase involved in cell wall biosynthesis
MNRNPLISIITINRNNRDGLLRTLQSVSRQRFADLEQIVVDGASTDGSAEIPHASFARVSHWISEPDTGIYHAMNKGLALARGTWLLFLNSGDHLLDESSLEQAAASLTDHDLQSFALETRLSQGDPKVEFMRPPARPDFDCFLDGTLPHPSTLIRRTLFERFGPYDERLKICADWKAFMVWICRHQCTYRASDQVLSIFYRDGLSGDPRNADRLAAERERVLHEEFPAFLGQHDRLNALRDSRWIRLLQSLGLLWKF